VKSEIIDYDQNFISSITNGAKVAGERRCAVQEQEFVIQASLTCNDRSQAVPRPQRDKIEPESIFFQNPLHRRMSTSLGNAGVLFQIQSPKRKSIIPLANSLVLETMSSIDRPSRPNVSSHLLRPPPLFPHLHQRLPRLSIPQSLPQTIGLLRLPPLPTTQPQNRHPLRQVLLYGRFCVDRVPTVVLRAFYVVAEAVVCRVRL
jgi:hypothetical protein